MGDKTIAVLDSTRCVGCYACANACPAEAISMLSDAEGFPRPVLDRGKCIDCGLCASACPVLTSLRAAKSGLQEVYAAWSLDEEIRYESTSGGIFSELSLGWLARGGVLCGAQYGEGHKIEHVIVGSEEGLVRIRQSKYAQSDIGMCYREIKQLLREGGQVLFCGSPCQCAGLAAFLGGRPEGLFVVNFVCRGTNSPKAYASFLKWLESCYGARISRVWFKNKELGWNRFSTRIEFEDGRSYSEDRYHDLFIKGYIEQNLYMRECCHSCEFRDLGITGDVTLADFWGVTLEDGSEDGDLGTSLVIVNTEKGRELFDSIKSRLFWERKVMEDAFPGNACISESPKPNPNRSYFLAHLDDMPFDELCGKCFVRIPLAKRAVFAVRRRIGSAFRALALCRKR